VRITRPEDALLGIVPLVASPVDGPPLQPRDKRIKSIKKMARSLKT